MSKRFVSHRRFTSPTEDPNAYVPDGAYADGAMAMPPADEPDDLESDPTLDHSRVRLRLGVVRVVTN